MEELINRLSNHANSSNTGPQKAFFSNNTYKSHEIIKDNYKEIPQTNEQKKVVFIDGGNAQLIKKPHLSLQLVRVFAVAYKGKKLFSKTKQAFVLTTCSFKDEMCYTTECFGDDLGIEDLTFTINDETLREGITHADISKIGDVARRFAELALAKELAKEHPNSIIILDGTLQSTITNEEKYLNKLYEQAQANNVVIAALAKSTTLITQSGQNITKVLSDTSPLQTWYYTNLVTINNPKHQAEMIFTKLHARSSFVFRTEIYNQQKTAIPQLISTLTQHSNDVVLPGYPYGLIIADQFARVSNQEKGHYRTLILAKLRKQNTFEKGSIHEILDNIHF